MPERIQKLSQEVIGQIAAGEVVERPAAAIKELVENSLDAGASAVTVEIRDGGISYFRVTDNGSGIRQSDIRMAFERHATSKITQAKDLNAIQTLGFRGEALASIAAVARVTCTTRTQEDETGLKVQNDGGQIVSIEEAACPLGTTFVVKDLFYNTPVRLKFLKNPPTEAGFVSDLVMRLILSRPDVSFRYISQGKTLYHSAGDGKLESAVFAIYGSELTRTMRKVNGHESGLILQGYVGIGESGRSNRAHQSFFINGRYMRSALLSSAVEAACRERVMIGKYPACVLHLTMPYDTVDVNVHPNKLEVRFQNEAAVAEAVENIVSEAIRDRDVLEHPVQLQLTKDNPAPVVNVTKQTSVPPLPESVSCIENRPMVDDLEPLMPARPMVLRDSGDAGLMRTLPMVPPLADPPPPPEEKPLPVKQVQAEQVSSFLPNAEKPLRLIGVVFRTFILVEYEDNLLMIDQHAVHERLLFDQLMAAVDQQRCGQELLVPMVLTVTRREQALLAEHRELLESIGLVVEPFGDTEVSVRSIPMVLGQPETKEFLHEVIGQLESERGVVKLEKRRAAILQMACKHAVKGGEALSEAEIRDLVTRMIDQQVTPTCPHGRPLVIALSHRELDKRFKRIQ